MKNMFIQTNSYIICKSMDMWQSSLIFFLAVAISSRLIRNQQKYVLGMGSIYL